MIIPIISKVPFKYLYPTGDKQETQTKKHQKYYLDADIIAGDFHFIRRYLPPNLEGKIIITNTVTKEDVKLLTDTGVKTLITTTPEFAGRSFGTNVMEGVLVSIINKPLDQLTANDYDDMIKRIDLKPRIINLQVTA